MQEPAKRFNIVMERSKLPSAFQPGDKVGLETLINLLYDAKDADVVAVSFANDKVKYNLSIPIKNDGHPNTLRTYFRLANVDSAFVGPPVENGFQYNSMVAVEARRSGGYYKTLSDAGDKLIESAKREPEYSTNNKKEWLEWKRLSWDPLLINYNQIKKSEHNAFDASWENGSTHPEDLGEGFSETVLIDPDGNRTNFITGWYDYDEKKWISDSVGYDVLTDKLVYQRLPFAKKH
jgi:hypothetical protein